MKIYYTEISALSEDEMQIALELLPKERIEKIKRIKLLSKQTESIWAGLLLEYALREKGLQGRGLTFFKNADGKPYIAEYPGLFYNLSHSKECVALAMDDHPVGIDVERVRVDCRKLVYRFFAEEEIVFLQRNWSDELFTKFWTRKESYLKATGFGMRMPLEAFSTLQEQVKVNGKMPDEMCGEAVYYLASMRIEPENWLSVCRKEVQVDCLPEKADINSFLKKV